ncbi:pentapeptide repeat-containing protein [Micromonospora vulcania]|uniref:Pentapeptide repeat-containing protein n=1 Tax=Micromonospora vulcania TaxID=1441873 RepID=A0ABW1HGW0_9ACTN
MIEVLAVFVRTNVPQPDPVPETVPSSPLDVRAAVTVLGRRPAPDDEANSRVDLSGTLLGLGNAHMPETDLGEVDLPDADLHGARLRGADLHSTDLTGAELGQIELVDADLRTSARNGPGIAGCCPTTPPNPWTR